MAYSVPYYETHSVPYYADSAEVSKSGRQQQQHGHLKIVSPSARYGATYDVHVHMSICRLCPYAYTSIICVCLGVWVACERTCVSVAMYPHACVLVDATGSTFARTCPT